MTLARIAALALASGFALAACASWTREPELPLPDLDPATIQDRAGAQRALEAVSAARTRTNRSFDERARGCYRRVMINSCLQDVADERRLAESRFRQIEIRSRAVIRQARAIERAEAEASRIEEREASEEARQRRSASSADEKTGAQLRVPGEKPAGD